MNLKATKDKLGIVFSALCGVHCLITPLILLLPFTHDFFAPFHHNHEVIHLVLFILVFPLALSVVFKARRLKINTLLILASLGIFFLSLSVLNNFVHFFEHESLAEVFLAVLGSAFLISAHLKSLRTCKSA